MVTEKKAAANAEKRSTRSDVASAEKQAHDERASILAKEKALAARRRVHCLLLACLKTVTAGRALRIFFFLQKSTAFAGVFPSNAKVAFISCFSEV